MESTTAMLTSSSLNSSETPDGCNSFKCLAYTITYSLMVPIGLFSNLMALIVFLRFTPKKTANTVFMTNLAISDVCFTSTLPFRLIYYFRQCQWEFWDWLCRWCVFSFYVNLYTSVLFLTGLSVLRYLAVVHPIRSKNFVTTRRASLACFGIWVFVAAASIPFLLSGTVKDGEITRCFVPESIKSWKRILILNYVALFLGFLMPFIIILGCYGFIIKRLFADRKIQKSKQMQRRRSVYIIVVILSTFLLCFMPYHIIRTLYLHYMVEHEKDGPLLSTVVISQCTAAANSCLNPLLYYFAGESFRTTFRASIRRTSRNWASNSLNSSFRERMSRRTSVRGCQQDLVPAEKLDLGCK